LSNDYKSLIQPPIRFTITFPNLSDNDESSRDEWISDNSSDQEDPGIIEMRWIREDIFAIIFDDVKDADRKDHLTFISVLSNTVLFSISDVITLEVLAQNPVSTHVQSLLVLRETELLILDCQTFEAKQIFVPEDQDSELTDMVVYVEKNWQKLQIALCIDKEEFRVLEYQSPC
jgi:hypothetical protein